MDDVKFLRAVRAKIEDPAHWCRVSYFRNDLGQAIWNEDDYSQASQWSLGGAAQAVMGYTSGATYRLATLLGFAGPYPINQMNGWQDHPLRTHAEVLARIDASIRAFDSGTRTQQQSHRIPDLAAPIHRRNYADEQTLADVIRARTIVPDDPPPPPFEGKGGTFGGAGATGSWDEPIPDRDEPRRAYDPPAPSPSYDPPSSSGGYDSGSSSSDSGSSGGGGSD